jgi:ABC-type transport system involved in multi-copper enzyme maturation permease subunit
MSEINILAAPSPLPNRSTKSGNRTCACLAECVAAIVNIRTIGALVIKELFRRKDFYALFILTALITLILGSVNFFNESHVVRYLKEICLFLIWISSLVIAITTTARQIPAERESRTIFPLLAKPVTRAHVILGKFLGCWQASGIALFVFYLFFGIVSGAREHHWPLTQYFQAITLHWFMLGVLIAMTLLGSLVFAAPSSNNTITFVVAAGILLVGRHLNKLALQLQEPGQTLVYAIYFAIPHLELFDMRDLIIHELGSIEWLIWLGALGYAAVYAALLLLAACLLFRRKVVN